MLRLKLPLLLLKLPLRLLTLPLRLLTLPLRLLTLPLLLLPLRLLPLLSNSARKHQKPASAGFFTSMHQKPCVASGAGKKKARLCGLFA